MDAEASFESTAALDLVDPDQPDETAPGGYLGAVDERPRTVIVVVLQLLLLRGDPSFLILLERLLPGARVSGPRPDKQSSTKWRAEVMKGGPYA